MKGGRTIARYRNRTQQTARRRLRKPLDEPNLQHTSTLQILLRFFLPSLIGAIAILLVYVLYRWKVAFDEQEMQKLRPDILSTKMEALAAERKALRKGVGNTDKSPLLKQPPPSPDSETKTDDDGNALSF
jgi:cell division protein FtsB